MLPFQRANLFHLFPLFFLLVSVVSHSSEKVPQPEHLTEGPIITTLPVFQKTLSNPIFYTTFFPIIFEFQQPQWEQADLRIKWPSGHSTNCNGTEAISYFTQVGCPSVYHYNSVIGRFYVKTQQQAFGSLHQDVHNGGPSLPISCAEISSHFENSESNPSSSVTWDYYWKLLESCPIRDFHKEAVNYGLAKIDLTKLDYMLQRFYDWYASSVYNHASYVGGAVYTSAYAAYQSVSLLEHSIEMQRWSDSLNLCNNQRLPRHLVDYSKLNSTLNLVKVKIEGKFYIQSASHPSQYYKLPLTDCTRVSKNNSLLIRTLVPIIPSKANLTLVELQPIPFTSNFDVTSPTNLVCGMKDVQGTYVMDSESGYIAKSHCKSRELCFVSPNDHLWNDPCLSSILNANTSSAALLERCQTSCQPVPTTKFPLFSRLSRSNILAIVGYSVGKEIFISCNGNPYKVIKPKETGVLLVQLSCNCKVVYNLKEFHAQVPCNATISIQHVNFGFAVRDQSTITTTSQDDSVTEIIPSDFNPRTIRDSLNMNRDEKNCIGEQWIWLLYLACILGVCGFLSLVWQIVDVARKSGGSSDVSNRGEISSNSDHFPVVAYTANRNSGLQTGVDNPMAYLVQKEQNVL